MIVSSSWNPRIFRLYGILAIEIKLALSHISYGFSYFSLDDERKQNERFLAKFRRAPPNDCINLIFTVYTQNDLSISTM